MAKQNVDEIARSLDLIEKNTLALQQEISLEISPRDGEILSDGLRSIVDTRLKAEFETRDLQQELNRVLPSQEAVRKHAQVLFHRMNWILVYHQSEEAKFGIVPPPEPKD